jgi:membrane-associated HD superfamily phosphohydrolase
MYSKRFEIYNIALFCLNESPELMQLLMAADAKAKQAAEKVAQARAETDAKIVRAKAEAEARITQARAEAEARIAQARAEAEARIVHARAEADAQARAEVKTQADAQGFVRQVFLEGGDGFLFDVEMSDIRKYVALAAMEISSASIDWKASFRRTRATARNGLVH